MAWEPAPGAGQDGGGGAVLPGAVTPDWAAVSPGGLTGPAGQRWPVERTNAWHNSFNRLQRCYERNEDIIDAFFDLADAIITVRRLIREAWTLYRWVGRPARRP